MTPFPVGIYTGFGIIFPSTPCKGSKDDQSKSGVLIAGIWIRGSSARPQNAQRRAGIRVPSAKQILRSASPTTGLQEVSVEDVLSSFEYEDDGLTATDGTDTGDCNPIDSAVTPGNGRISEIYLEIFYRNNLLQLLPLLLPLKR